LDSNHVLPALGQPGALPPAPSTGLIGRRAEAVELASLLSPADEGPLWVTGYHGIGKTALLTHVARSLLQSGRFERIVYTSIGRTGVADSVLYDLGQVLFGSGYRLTEDSPAQIEQALQAVPTLVVWDDADAILYGGSLALEQSALVTWYQLANRIAACSPSALCVISNGAALPPSARRLARLRPYALGPLQDQEAIELALAFGGSASEAQSRETWSQLIQWLGGHPLALRSLWAAAEGTLLQDVASQLAARIPGLSSGEARFRNRAMDISLDHLATRVAPPLAEHLGDLAFFVGGFVENLGPETMGLSPEQWTALSEPLSRAGLTWNEPFDPLTIPWVRLHPALQQWSARKLTGSRRSELAAAQHGPYLGFITWVLNSAPRLRDSGPRLIYRELGNIALGLNSLLALNLVAEAVDYAWVYSSLLKELGLAAETKRANDALNLAAEALLPQDQPWSRAGVALALKQAEALMAAPDLQKAGAVLSQLAVRMEKSDGLSYHGREATEDHVRVLVALARVLRDTGHPDVAARALSDALNLLNRIEADDSVRTERARLYGELLEVYLRLGQLEHASDAGERALESLEGLEATRLRSELHVRRAYVALRQNSDDRAREQLQHAADLMTSEEDLPGLASVESQFAALAMRPPADLPDAIRHLESAASYAHQSHQWPTEAQLHTQIAQIAAQNGSDETCEDHLREAVSIYEDNRAFGSLLRARASLSEHYLRSGRAGEAQQAAERALADAGDSQSAVPWELYLLLSRIAETQGDREASTRWLAAAREGFSASSAAEAVLSRWEPLITALVQSVRGEALDSDTASTLESLENNEQTKSLARRLWRILSGERSTELYADLQPGDGLVVRTLLDRIGLPPAAAESMADQ